ncbi:MAG: hypothetical protein ED859_00715 [Desulfuromonadales bacterium]|nr:MAG: hypothetical protein ED859_00715 [Desulfuromonadales bacterium]
MRCSAVAFVMALSVGLAGFACAGGGAKSAIKVGEQMYVCGCGEKCPCDSMAHKAGKCTCGKDLVKVQVVRVEEGTTVVSVDGRERSFKSAGKFACACGSGCDCGTIAQSKGKCSCGRPLKDVKAKP